MLFFIVLVVDMEVRPRAESLHAALPRSRLAPPALPRLAPLRIMFISITITTIVYLLSLSLLVVVLLFVLLLIMILVLFANPPRAARPGPLRGALPCPAPPVGCPGFGFDR